MPRDRGFGKAAQALSVGKDKKANGKKNKGEKLETYSLAHFGSDRCVHVIEIKAKSKREALRKFRFFTGVLELCLSGASDEQILKFDPEFALTIANREPEPSEAHPKLGGEA
jgi:hypothetical protein